MASDASAHASPALLTPEEVGEVLSAISEYDPIVIGGQCISMWVDYLSRFDAEIAMLGSVSSADVDYFEHPQAAEKLKQKLRGEILWPDDAISLSPNFCTVAAFVNGKQIHIDFMRKVVGVKPDILMARCVVISGLFPNIDGEVRLALMHPLDCIQSRLANIEVLGRHDKWSMAQTDASFKVLAAFIRYLLSLNEVKEAAKTILSYEYVLRDWFYRTSVYPHVVDRIDPVDLVEIYVDDEVFDPRWREKLLTKMVARLREYEAQVRRRLNI